MKGRKWLGLIVIAAVLVLSLVIVFHKNDPATIARIISGLHPGWITAAAGCWFGFLFLDAVGYYAYYRRHGHAIGLWYSVYVTLMGTFYSGITPGSSGGQPMQVYYLKKAGVPVAVGTAGLSVRFALGQLSSVLIVPVIWLAGQAFLHSQLRGLGWLVWLGWSIHLCAVLLIASATFFQPQIQRLATGLVRLGARLHLVADPEKTGDRLRQVLDGYHENMIQTVRRPGEMLLQLMLSALSVALLMMVAVCVYFAFGLTGTPWWQVLAVAYLLYMSAGYNPLPGASGAQEGGFLLFYRGIFPQGQIGLAMLVWRFVSYYLSLLTGAAVLGTRSIRDCFSRKATADKTE